MASIIATFSREFERKFRAGQSEHGGDVRDRECLSEAYNESLDLVCYLSVEAEKKKKMLDMLSNWNGSNFDAETVVLRLVNLYGLKGP